MSSRSLTLSPEEVRGLEHMIGKGVLRHVEAGERKANQTACNCLKGNYKHHRSMFSSAVSDDTALNRSHRSWPLRRKFL